MYDRIAVVGDKESVFAFKAVGVEVYGTSNSLEARDIVRRLAKEGVKVIFITEQLAAQLDGFLEKLKSRAYPAVIPIPGRGERLGLGVKGIKKDMEKAICADILFRD